VLSASRQGLRDGRRLAGDIHVGVRGQQCAQTPPRGRFVVDQQRGDRAVERSGTAVRWGSRTSATVPPPARGEIVRPTRGAVDVLRRSRVVEVPTPGSGSGGGPAPSSSTRSSTTPSIHCALIVRTTEPVRGHRRPCRTAFSTSGWSRNGGTAAPRLQPTITAGQQRDKGGSPSRGTRPFDRRDDRIRTCDPLTPSSPGRAFLHVRHDHRLSLLGVEAHVVRRESTRVVPMRSPPTVPETAALRIRRPPRLTSLVDVSR
jgi:hypothetical protein